jgi:hypothetical protein
VSGLVASVIIKDGELPFLVDGSHLPYDTVYKVVSPFRKLVGSFDKRKPLHGVVFQPRDLDERVLEKLDLLIPRERELLVNEFFAVQVMVNHGDAHFEVLLDHGPILRDPSDSEAQGLQIVLPPQEDFENAKPVISSNRTIKRLIPAEVSRPVRKQTRESSGLLVPNPKPSVQHLLSTEIETQVLPFRRAGSDHAEHGGVRLN